MTKQEVFDKVVAHARKQGCRSEVKKYDIEGYSDKWNYTGCRYRGPGGTKCFIGALIPDEHYDPSLEGQGVHSEKVMAIMIAIGVLGAGSDKQLVTGGFLGRLQGIHDTYCEEAWEGKFQDLARDNQLVYTPPEGKTT